jgi:hypothetical protein
LRSVALPPELPDHQDSQRVRRSGNGCRDTRTLGDAICIAKECEYADIRGYDPLKAANVRRKIP